jgi:hypothetical protein
MNRSAIHQRIDAEQIVLQHKRLNLLLLRETPGERRHEYGEQHPSIS